MWVLHGASVPNHKSERVVWVVRRVGAAQIPDPYSDPLPVPIRNTRERETHRDLGLPETPKRPHSAARTPRRCLRPHEPMRVTRQAPGRAARDVRRPGQPCRLRLRLRALARGRHPSSVAGPCDTPAPAPHTDPLLAHISRIAAWSSSCKRPQKEARAGKEDDEHERSGGGDDEAGQVATSPTGNAFVLCTSCAHAPPTRQSRTFPARQPGQPRKLGSVLAPSADSD